MTATDLRSGIRFVTPDLGFWWSEPGTLCIVDLGD
jgi:hypothetical protein